MSIRSITSMLVTMCLVLTISFSAMSGLAHAGFFGGNNKKGRLLDQFGIASNTNRPEIWQDQLGGFMSGGSIHARVPSTNLQIMSFDPPSFNAGCGGIDLFGGGFGYINSENLEILLKNIGSSSASYLMMLTIKSISPQVSDLLENLEAMSRFMNSQNINSCQMGASIAAGLFPKNQASQALACQSRKMGSGSGDDIGTGVSNFFTARYDCSKGDNVMNENDKPKDGMLGSEYNLVWEALKKESSGLSQEDKEFLMSLSGTIIAKKKPGSNDKIIFEHENSLIKDSEMFDVMVFGTKNIDLKLYSCDDKDKCLRPKGKKVPFKADNAMLTKIHNLLDSISEKFILEQKGSDQTLSPAEKELATRTSVPIIKLISLNASLKGHGVKLTVEDYAEAVAFDYVIVYLDSLVEFVYKALGRLEHAQVEGEVIRDFKNDIKRVKRMLYEERVKSYERLNTLLSVKQRTGQVENVVRATFGDYRGTHVRD